MGNIVFPDDTVGICSAMSVVSSLTVMMDILTSEAENIKNEKVRSQSQHNLAV